MIENAVEGCIRETFGALVATWQARMAKDPVVRAHMKRIAREETSHAALAWKADAWARGKLDRNARARVDAAKRDALRTLKSELGTPSDDAETRRVAGLPSANEARALLEKMATLLD